MTDELKAEIARLTAERDEARAMHKDAYEQYTVVDVRLREVLAERDAARADRDIAESRRAQAFRDLIADRDAALALLREYQWSGSEDACCIACGGHGLTTGHEADCPIDALLKETL